MKFSGKVVLLTGASSGIGYATALHLAKLGASLSLIGRNVQKLKQLEGECHTIASQKHLLLPGDIAAEKDTERILSQTIEAFGKLDVLINNAGVLEFGSIENTNLNQFDRIMSTNIRPIYHLTMLAAPHLIKSHGNIVNVSSINGIRSFPGLLAFNVSKAAVDQFTRCVALELAPKNVRCNAINPGVIVTNLHRRSGMSGEEYEKFLEHCRTTHPLGRPGDAKELAQNIAFLASDEASFITGISLSVDGGRHAVCPR